jgi:hypothetical protein
LILAKNICVGTTDSSRLFIAEYFVGFDNRMVSVSGWETTYTEIVPSDRLRPKSTEPSITAKTFITFQLDVPRELQVRFHYEIFAWTDGQLERELILHFHPEIRIKMEHLKIFKEKKFSSKYAVFSQFC